MPVALLAREPAVTLDRVTADWRRSLDAASGALSAAGRIGGLPPGELAARSREVAAERSAVTALLDEIAQETHVAIRHPLSAPRATNRMLGLPVAVRACLFDLDGVLTGSAQVHAAAWRDTLDSFVAQRSEATGQRFSAQFFDLHRDYDRLIHGRPRLDGVRAFLSSRGIALPEGQAGDRPGSHTVHGLANRKNELFQRRLAREPMATLRGAGRYLDAATEAGLDRAVVSPSSNTRAILERAELGGFVEVCVDGRTMAEENLAPKPAPDVLVFACERLGVDPEQAAAFETLPVGVQAARAGGIGFVVGVDRHGRQTLTRAGADIVVADLAELLDPALGGSRGATNNDRREP
jgi:beta-phosphoglucomutase-like phosphatase (HAD superfamily)